MRWLLLLGTILAQTASGGKFDFNMFENFLLTEKVFIQEQFLVASLQRVKRDLDQMKRALEGDEVQKMKNKMASLLELSKSIDNGTSSFGTEDDVQGASRGLVMLRETYNMDPRAMGLGILNVQGPTGGEVRAAENLNQWDMLGLASTALNIGWLDDSVDFAKALMAVRQVNELVQPYLDR